MSLLLWKSVNGYELLLIEFFAFELDFVEERPCITSDNGGYVKTGFARLRQPLFLLSFIAGKVKTAR